MLLCSNPRPQYLAHQQEIDQAIRRVLDSGWYILGPEVAAFENEFAQYLGCPHALGVGSGTEALHLALAACETGAGDEVITVSHTAVATVAAIELAGATPVMVDIDPHTFNIDPNTIASAITPRTRAIIPVHLYGRPCDMHTITALARQHHLKVIEDCSQAHGASIDGKRVGSFGQLACFSFYPTKNLGALGDGGMVVGSEPAVMTRARQLREYGWVERYISHLPGWNTRLDELQAAILRVKLPHLDADNQARRAIAKRYTDALQNLPLTLPSDAPGHVYHQYVIMTPQRNELLAHLRSREIACAVHYPQPVHLQPAYTGRIKQNHSLPHTEHAANHVMSLPIYPELTLAEQQQVIHAITDYFAAQHTHV
jgi:dTDP-4-amino-4,6-dideoxygalactose transaminase